MAKMGGTAVPGQRAAWHSVVAGGSAGLLSELLTYPISTAKARLQVQRVARGETAAYRNTAQTLATIVRAEGLPKLYSGFGAVLFCAAPSRGAYFAAYEAVKSAGSVRLTEAQQPMVHVGAGAVAQLAGSLLWVPQDVVKERLQIQVDPLRAAATSSPSGGAVAVTASGHGHGHDGPKFTGSVNAVRRIVAEEGVRGLYRGYFAHQVVWTPYNALYFGAYENIKGRWIANAHRLPGYTAPPAGIDRSVAAATAALPAYAFPLCAGAGGAVASALTAPLDTVKTRLQTQGNSGQYKGGVDCVRQIIAHEGGAALFRGLGARIMFLAPNHAITMFLYEYVMRHVAA